MSRVATAAELATSATNVDLTNDALAHPRVIGSVFNHTDKFVTDGAFEVCIATGDLEIRVADSGQENTNDCFCSSLWFLDLLNSEIAFFYPQGFHLWDIRWWCR
jgi:hypothetical protein